MILEHQQKNRLSAGVECTQALTGNDPRVRNTIRTVKDLSDSMKRKRGLLVELKEDSMKRKTIV